MLKHRPLIGDAPALKLNRELSLAFIAIAFITTTYLLMAIMLGGVPAAREFYGHSLGIMGFVLMVMTETLYSLRKRSRSARWGRMASWLQFHIFTGIVGPYLVLLHSSWKFNGLAGIVMLMTVLIVLSGFIGRYIYTSIPRTADGAEIQATELLRQIKSLEAAIQEGLGENPNRMDRGTSRRIERLRGQHRSLSRQVNTLASMRKLFAVWHALHIPLGLSLFTAAIIHIVAAIYYGSLLW